MGVDHWGLEGELGKPSFSWVINNLLAGKLVQFLENKTSKK